MKNTSRPAADFKVNYILVYSILVYTLTETQDLATNGFRYYRSESGGLGLGKLTSMSNK